MKEALERVKSAETLNQKKKQQLLADLAAYQAVREKELATIQTNHLKERKIALEKIQLKQQQLLQEQKATWENLLATEKDKNEQLFATRQEAIILEIVKEVGGTYDRLQTK